MATDTENIDVVYGYFDNKAQIPPSALLNGDTHSGRLVALAGALTDEQAEIALRAIARIVAGRDVPSGLTEYVVNLCRQRAGIKYASVDIEWDDEGPMVLCLFYGEGDVDRDQWAAFDRVLEVMPAYYQYVPISSRNEPLSGGHWWLLAQSFHRGTVVYDRDGDVKDYLLTAGEEDIIDAAGLSPSREDYMGHVDQTGGE